jgi:hypothetical protein
MDPVHFDKKRKRLGQCPFISQNQAQVFGIFPAICFRMGTRHLFKETHLADFSGISKTGTVFRKNGCPGFDARMVELRGTPLRQDDRLRQANERPMFRGQVPGAEDNLCICPETGMKGDDRHLTLSREEAILLRWLYFKTREQGNAYI